ncbi:MAG TPA: hypothetical protein VF530_11975 [Planctomycetota bacterium]
MCLPRTPRRPERPSRSAAASGRGLLPGAPAGCGRAFRARRGPRFSGFARLLALGCLALAACLGRGGERASVPAAPPPPLASEANEAAFRALAAALRAGQDAQAGALIQRLRQGTLGAAELGLLDSAERVLAGRALVRGLALALRSEPLAEEPGRFRLVLEASSSASEPLRLRLPPADLKRLRTSIDVRGVEGLEFESKASHALADLVVPPGVTTRAEVLTYELALGRALAVRERWRLEPRAGEIECAGLRYPAQGVRVEGCERERLSPLVASGPAEAGALAAQLEGQAEPAVRGLLELALRTPPEAREAALAELAPVVARLARTQPERVAAAEPALRWWTQNRDLGPDAAAWARYLAVRARGAEASGGDALDLPDRAREEEVR